MSAISEAGSTASAEEVDEQIRREWAETFRRQARTGLMLILGGNMTYLVANLTFQAPGFERMAALQVLHSVVLISGYWYLRLPRTWERLQANALAQAAYTCLSTAMVGGIAGRTISTALTVVTMAFVSPALLPWGVGVQVALSVAGVGAIFLNSLLIGGPVFGPGSIYAIIGTAIALVCSVFMAQALERARRAVARQELLRSWAEQDVRELNAELESRIEERTSALELALSELQSFTYTISHDLRSPLRGINGLARIVADDPSIGLDDESKGRLERICKVTMRMDAMIDALLSLGRVAQTNLQRDRLDLSTMAATIAADLGSAEPGREVDVRIAPDLNTEGDSALVEMVLTNLLQNAWKYTRDSEHPSIEFGSNVGTTGVSYFVRDNGRGFEMAHADRIFEPFLRLDAEESGERAVEGTGIGLTTVQRIVRRHGGRIWVDSTPGEGATFSFTLARADS